MHNAATGAYRLSLLSKPNSSSTYALDAVSAASKAGGNRMHDRTHLLRLTPSYRNDPAHNHATNGYALNTHNIEVQLVQSSALGGVHLTSVCDTNVASGAIVVCVDNATAQQWADALGAGKHSGSGS